MTMGHMTLRTLS